jgi:hypothetical protein
MVRSVCIPSIAGSVLWVGSVQLAEVAMYVWPVAARGDGLTCSGVTLWCNCSWDTESKHVVLLCNIVILRIPHCYVLTDTFYPIAQDRVQRWALCRYQTVSNIHELSVTTQASNKHELSVTKQARNKHELSVTTQASNKHKLSVTTQASNNHELSVTKQASNKHELSVTKQVSNKHELSVTKQASKKHSIHYRILSHLPEVRISTFTHFHLQQMTRLRQRLTTAQYHQPWAVCPSWPLESLLLERVLGTC